MSTPPQSVQPYRTEFLLSIFRKNLGCKSARGDQKQHELKGRTNQFQIGFQIRRPNRTSCRPPIRRTIFVCAEPHRICQCCSELGHIKVKRALRTWLLVRCVVQFAMNQSVVAVSHVIALITIAHRTSKPVVSLFKKAPRMHGLLDEEHRDIVIKTQWGNSEEHSQPRYLSLHWELQGPHKVSVNANCLLPGLRFFVNWIR